MIPSHEFRIKKSGFTLIIKGLSHIHSGGPYTVSKNGAAFHETVIRRTSPTSHWNVCYRVNTCFNGMSMNLRLNDDFMKSSSVFTPCTGPGVDMWPRHYIVAMSVTHGTAHYHYGQFLKNSTLQRFSKDSMRNLLFPMRNSPHGGLNLVSSVIISFISSGLFFFQILCLFTSFSYVILTE